MLKLLVNENWCKDQKKTLLNFGLASNADKENIPLNTQKQFLQSELKLKDKNVVRQYVFQALDQAVQLSADPSYKVIVSSLENIIYNVT